MGKIIRAAAGTCIWFLTVSSVHAERDVNEISGHFAQRMASNKTWQASMKQLLELPDMEPIMSEADIAYAKPDKLKIVIEKPQPQWLVLYETAGWFQRGRSPRQSADLPASSGPLALYQFLPKLLNGSLEQLRVGYLLSGQTIREDLYQMTLSAESDSVNPETILCQIDPATLQMKSLQLKFRERQAVITMIFKEIVVNEALSKDVFKIEANAPGLGTKKR